MMRLIRQTLLFLAACLCGTATAIADGPINADFSVTNPADPGFGWTLTGAENSLAPGTLRLKEDGFVFPRLAQSFTLPAGKDFLEIRLQEVDLQANNPGELPDALQLSLRLDGQAHPLALQTDGTLTYAAGFEVPGAGASGTVWAPTWPVDLRFDLSGLASDAAAELEVLLISSDLALSSVELGRIRLVRRARLSDDSGLTTPFETPLEIHVLANDSDIDAPLDPATVVVSNAPAHGQTSVNPLNGRITYTPAAGYSGADAFTYTVADINGDPARAAATVSLTVEAGAAPESPLEIWRVAAFGAAAAADPVQEATVWGNEADPDRDGHANLIEYFSNLNPLTAEGGPVFEMVTRSGGVYLRYRQSTQAGMTLFPAFETKMKMSDPWAPLILSAIVVATGEGYQWREGLLNPSAAQGFFRMVVTPVEGNPLEDWQLAAFGAGAVADPVQEATVWGDDADPDRDGHANLIEYFCNLDPLQSSAGPVFEMSTRNGRLYLRFRRSTATGMTLLPSFERKASLLAPWVPLGLTATVVATQDGYQWWEAPVDAYLAQGFFRMVITNRP